VSFENEKHRKQWLSSLDDVFKAFGTKRVDAVTSADLLAALSSNWVTRPEISSRIFQRIRVIFEWCKARQPAARPYEGSAEHRASQHHAATAYQKVPAFVHALQRSRDLWRCERGPGIHQFSAYAASVLIWRVRAEAASHTARDTLGREKPMQASW
jgi:hypothetical protein